MANLRKNSLLELLKQEPDDSFLNYALALELNKEGKQEDAIQLIEKVLTKDENYLGAYLQLGQLYEEVGNTVQALISYKKGSLIAQKQKNTKALSEINQAIFLLEE